MELELNISNVFEKNYDVLYEREPSGNLKWKYILNEGGSRSGKTYSILQIIIHRCLTTVSKVSVVRKTLASMYDSVISDFINIMKDLGLYDERNHNMSKNTYEFPNRSVINFFGADDENKIKGTKRDLLYINEATDLSEASWVQLGLRTTGQIIMDYNPCEYEHWIYRIKSDKKAITIHSTYLDNDYLTKSQIDYIENLINVDENWYRVYVLGLAPISKTRIYSHFQTFENDPYDLVDISYGLDFGYDHALVLVEVMTTNRGAYYIREIIYRSELTTSDLIKLMSELEVDRKKVIWADSASPAAIEAIRRAGWNIRGADKSAGSVKGGIDKIKGSEIFIHKNSNGLWNEVNKYSWKSNRDGTILNEPVKLFDDGMDAMRYAIFSEKIGGGGSKFRFSRYK